MVKAGTIVIGIIVLAVIAGVLFMLPKGGLVQQPGEEGLEGVSKEATLEFGVETESIERNTLLYASLVDAGIDNALVDVTRERVLVRFELPQGHDLFATVSYIFGLSAEIEPNVATVTVQRFEGEAFAEEFSAKTSDIKAFSEGKITEQEFSGKVEHKTAT